MPTVTTPTELQSATPQPVAGIRSGLLATLAVTTIVMVLANLWVILYVGQEKYVYHWDWSGYWMRFREASAMLLGQPVMAFTRLISSIRNEDYNLLPVWPLAPFAWMAGGGRLPYISAVTSLYLVPAVLLLASLVARQQGDRRVWLPAAFTILLAHPLWVPVLRGYPDVVGLLIIALLLQLNFRHPDVQPSIQRALLTAALLCLLVVMRRWYAFWVVSFVPMLAIVQLLALQRRQDLSLRTVLPVVRDAALATIGFVALLFIVATPFAIKMVTTSYADIYAAYRLSESTTEVLAKLGAHFGLLIVVASLAGLLLMVRSPRSMALAQLLLGQSVLIFLLFARTQDFGEQHYYLLLPTCVLGLATLTARLWTIGRSASGQLLLSLGFMTVIATSSLAVLSSAAREPWLAGMPQVRYPPLVRHDFAELDRLHARLDDLMSGEPGDLYVLASSTLLNSSIVLNHCRLGSPARAFCAKVLTTHDVDRRDGFPQPFLSARFVVVTEPLQFHLRPEDQRVIGTLAHAIGDRRLLGNAYERLPGEYRLDGQVSAFIYRRTADHEATALQALQDEFLTHYPQERYGFRFITPATQRR